jgi:hypothetical protein
VSATLGPFRFLSFVGGIGDLARGQERPEALRNMDERLPQPNSLRRTTDDTKAAVLAAVELLRAERLTVSDRMGLYVGQQQIALEYCSKFLQTSYREGPRMASPMYFAESVANNVATHLSLTLGMQALAQTFIGTRAAGIQAVLAAAEDVESGLVETGLVVALGVATQVTRDAYSSVFHPFRRRQPPEAHFLRGALAALVRRDAAGQPRISFAGVRCSGRTPEAQLDALRSLWDEAGPRMSPGTRVLESTLSMAGARSRSILRRVGPTLPSAEGLGESYALDPFARLLLDGVLHPGPEGRAVLCLGEEGTAGLLALDGPPRLVAD